MAQWRQAYRNRTLLQAFNDRIAVVLQDKLLVLLTVVTVINVRAMAFLCP